MQDLAQIPMEGGNIPVLRRPTRFGVMLKIRRGGTPSGVLLTDEAAYLREKPEMLKALLEGYTIKL